MVTGRHRWESCCVTRWSWSAQQWLKCTEKDSGTNDCLLRLMPSFSPARKRTLLMIHSEGQEFLPWWVETDCIIIIIIIITLLLLLLLYSYYQLAHNVWWLDWCIRVSRCLNIVLIIVVTGLDSSGAGDLKPQHRCLAPQTLRKTDWGSSVNLIRVPT